MAKKNKVPAFLFYPDNFIGGISLMTMEDRGIYITLLCHQALHGIIPTKKTQLLIGMKWDDLSQDIKDKFEVDKDGNAANTRLEKELEKRTKFIDKQRENGKKGGRPKKPKENPTVNPDNNPNHNPNKSLYEIEIEIDNKFKNEFTKAYGSSLRGGRGKLEQALTDALKTGISKADLVKQAEAYHKFCIVKERKKKDICNWLNEGLYSEQYKTENNTGYYKRIPEPPKKEIYVPED